MPTRADRPDEGVLANVTITTSGFPAFDEAEKSTAGSVAETPTTNGDWPGWRGANRDARVAWLPDTLPVSAIFEWTAELAGEGLGGIAVGSGFVVLGSRDALDRSDVFQCFDADDGTVVWQHAYPAKGRLDYGNSPRATPLIHGEYVYTLGAFGQLCCIELETGIMVWQLNIAEEFGSPKMIWGHSGSPLIADDKIILQPGGRKASLVALECETGDVVWITPGIEPSYSSFLTKQVGGQTQVIGYDAKSLGGWDVETGRRLWSVIPPVPGDFNVPTVVALDERLVVSSENNGTRIYHFNHDGTLHPEPDFVNNDLRPDSHTPVVSGSRLFGIWSELYGLDPQRNLATVNTLSDDAFAGYGSLIASDSRLLALTSEGELLLIDTSSPNPMILSRLDLTNERKQVLSHPAVAGDSLYLRLGTSLCRLKLGAN